MILLVASMATCKFWRARQSELPTSIETIHAPRVSLLQSADGFENGSACNVVTFCDHVRYHTMLAS